MVYSTQTLVFFGFDRNIELKTNPTAVLSYRARREPWERGWLKTNKHEFVDIIHQNKPGFDGKKLSEGQAGRNSLCFNNLCCRLRRIGDRHAKILTVLLSPFSCLFCLLSSRILQNNLLYLYLQYLVEIRRYKLSFFAKTATNKSRVATPFEKSLRKAQNSPEAGTRHIFG